MPLVVVAIYALVYGAAWYGVWDVHREEPGDPLAYLGVVWVTFPWSFLAVWLPLPPSAWWFLHLCAGINAACLYLMTRRAVVRAIARRQLEEHAPSAVLRQVRWKGRNLEQGRRRVVRGWRYLGRWVGHKTEPPPN